MTKQMISYRLGKQVRLLALAALFLAPFWAWGQTRDDYSGVYYIASRDWNANNTTTNFYLCPTEEWAYYQSSSPYYYVYSSGCNTDTPFMTTYQCRGGSYNAENAVWIVEKHPTLDFYYIKRAIDGKYLTYNRAMAQNSNAGRMRVHLEASPADDDALFGITYVSNSSCYEITTKKYDSGTTRKYLNVTGPQGGNGNINSLQGTNARTDGPSGCKNVGGIIGLYTAGASDSNGKWYLEPATVAAPTITNNFDGTINITAASGATIYYTTDGTTPTMETPTYGTTPVTVTLTNGVQVIKAIAKASSDYFPSLVSTYEIPVCERPVISVRGTTATIICSTPNASIYYALDDASTTPSTLYERPFDTGGAETIRAIATSSGYLQSEVAYYYPAIEVSSSTQITNMNGRYILLDGFSSSASIGDADHPFCGQIEGNCVVLSGLDHPLVAYSNGAIIKNVFLDNVHISSGTNVGAICGEATGASRIYNCGILSGGVGGSGYVGGIVGLLDGESRVINCFSYATITGGDCVAGIVGYNNYSTTADDIKTMVMNCMFYGDITGGTTVSPVYGGNNIANLPGGLNTFNYYAYDELKTKEITPGKYNSALAVEKKFLNRFEFYRLLLNSNKKLAAFYATGFVEDADQMLKWVLETADRNIANPKPYPILKQQGYYPSIINPDMDNAPDSTAVGPNKGGKLPSSRGTLSVTISTSKTDGGQTWPTGAGVTTTSLTLTRTDKDFDRFNFNYDKVQLPYYNDVGTGNYTGNRVVTGWKITAIDAVTGDPYTNANYNYDKNYANNPEYFDYPNYNFADRKSSNKDLYSVSGRVFSQGAYFDVPYGVTSITIEPYWAKACYISDPNYDVVYQNDYSGKQNVTQTGTQATTFTGGQIIKNNVSDALSYINSSLGGYGNTVYDNAVVLVGNLHLDNVPSGGDKPFTMMSVDMDNDREPDYSLIYHHKERTAIAPIRYDFLNIPGTAQAQRPNNASLICNFTIFKTKGWFECTNTAFFYTSQIEYENLRSTSKTNAPFILLGGVVDQFVSTQYDEVPGKTIYIHVGGNAWIYSFGLGTHGDGSQATPHVPVSVTGGDYPSFYLTGTYNPDATVKDDNAECYISGGRFGELAGACQEQIGDENTTKGNVRWQIYNAEITEFFGGGIYDAKPVKGNITTEIFNSHVATFCGGPKFGNMSSGKDVNTTAEGCVFGQYFGAGYGGLSYSKKKYYDKDDDPVNWSTQQNNYTNDRGKYYDGQTTGLGPNNKYGYKGVGVATDFEYEYFVWSSGKTGGRFYVNFASFSLAQCNDVESILKKCTINGNFYGGGSLGKVTGTATSNLDSCVVKGNVYGAGFSATMQPIEVRDAGFTKNPKYNKESGMFEPGEFSGTTEFRWKNAAEAGVTLTNNQPGSDLTNHYIYTDQDMSKTNLGSVQEVSLTIGGNSNVWGSVFGGGDESVVKGNTEVKILDHSKVLGNIYGGGNMGEVGGNTKVIVNGHSSGSNTSTVPETTTPGD